MKKRMPLFVAAMILLLTPIKSAWAAEHAGDQGLGLMIGNPSGLSYKFWLDNTLALDAAAGVDQGEFDVHADVLWHNFGWARNIDDKLIKGITGSGEFPFYFGFGPRALFEHKTEFGLRFPLGLSYLPHESNWEFFTEFAPVLRLTPDTGVDADFAIGLRFGFQAIRPRSN